MRRWYNSFKEFSSMGMSMDLARVFATLTAKGSEPMPSQVKDTTAIFQLTTKRAEIMGMKLHDSLMVFISILADGKPGNIVIYLSALKLFAIDNSITEENMSMKHLTYLCPDGFLGDEAMGTLWNMQKVTPVTMLESDNMLDKCFIVEA